MRKYLALCIILLPFLSAGVMAQPGIVPVNYTVAAAVYSQTFDGLPASGTFSLTGKGPFSLSANPINAANISGWQFFMFSGTSTNAAFLPGTGSGTGNGCYSFGASGSSDRCLGTLASGTGIYGFGVIFTNQTGGLLNRITISFTAEQWRKGGSGNKNTWTFRYKTGNINSIDQPNLATDTSLNFSSAVFSTGAGNLNGNIAANQQSKNITLTNILWKPGEQLMLRWDDADESGNDDGMGIDNFLFSATLSSGPPIVVNSSVVSAGSGDAAFNAVVNDNFDKTHLFIQYDTSPLFTHPATISLPDSIIAGFGNDTISAGIHDLRPGTKYYCRIMAINGKGTSLGNTISFTTAITLPQVKTLSVNRFTKESVAANANVLASGGATVTERGIVWSDSINPTILHHRIPAGNDTGYFSVIIEHLPGGNLLYFRSYAINSGGIAYGEMYSVRTPVEILRFATDQTGKTNKDSIEFILETKQALQGLRKENFSVTANGMSGPGIVNITGSETLYRITVKSGNGDGRLGLKLQTDSNLSFPVDDLPVSSTNTAIIDNTPPIIRSVAFPDRPMKTGDTVALTIIVTADTETYRLQDGSINGFPVSGFTKKNDSLYDAFFVVANGGKDCRADENIAVNFVLSDEAGNRCQYTVPVIQAQDRIDANKPFIKEMIAPKKGWYKYGDSLVFAFRFSEVVWVSGGAPSFTLTVGTKTKNAIYKKGSGTDSLFFMYIIGSGDVDTDGIKTAGTITLHKSEITDEAGNTAIVTFSNSKIATSVFVDAVLPVVQEVLVPEPKEYLTGDTLQFRVVFSKPVVRAYPDSIPYLSLLIGNQTRKAIFKSMSGNSSIDFYYKIEDPDTDTNGIKIQSLFTGKTITDSIGNPANESLQNIGNTSAVYVNKPKAFIRSFSLPKAGLYKAGDTLNAFVVYSENIFIGSVKNPPFLNCTIGNTIRQLKYTSGSGKDSLCFQYRIQENELDTDGVGFSKTINLNGNTISDKRNYPVPMLIPDSRDSVVILVDGQAPYVKQFILPAPATYKAGDQLLFTCMMNENIFWLPGTDTPSLSITVGKTKRTLPAITAPGKDWIQFQYEIKKEETDTDGIRISNQLALGKNHITDSAGNSLNNAVPIPQLMPVIKVDAVQPKVTATKFISGDYTTGDSIKVIVSFSKKVWLLPGDTLPYIPIILSNKVHRAVYCSGNGSSNIEFAYIVEEADTDTSGIKISDKNITPSSCFRDSIGNTAINTLTNISGADKIRINKPEAVIKTVIYPKPGLYKAGDTLKYTICYTQKVFLGTAGNAPYIRCTIGNTGRQVKYQSGSGTDTLVFRYIIQVNESDEDGIETGASIILNGNTITDKRNYPVPLILPPPVLQGLVKVDGVKPFIQAVIPPKPGTYKTGDSLQFTIFFSETTDWKKEVDSPYLELTIGKTKRKLFCRNDPPNDSARFLYIIQKEETDSDGISIGNFLQAGKTVIRDIAGNEADLRLLFSSVPDVKVDAVSPHITAVLPPLPGDYKTGDTLLWTILFSKKIWLQRIDSNTYLSFSFGSQQRKVFYRDGSGTYRLKFSYIVDKTDIDTTGIRTDNHLETTIGNIKDSTGNNADVFFPALSTAGKIRLNKPTAGILDVAFPKPGIYKAGDTLICSILYSENIFIGNSVNLPYLRCNINGVNRQMKYREGSGTHTLTFSYTIQNGESDSTSVQIGNSIVLNGNSLTDEKSYNAPLLLPVQLSPGEIKIDGVAPQIREIIFPEPSVYREGDTLRVTVLFTETVTWDIQSDRPFLTLSIGKNKRTMFCDSGAISNKARFSYIIAENEADKDGLTLGSSVFTGNNTITDIAGNKADLRLPKTNFPDKLLVDAQVPLFLNSGTDSITRCSNTGAIDLGTFLGVQNSETGELLRWRIRNQGNAGSLLQQDFEMVSTGKKNFPVVQYSPSESNTISRDTVLIEVSDGINSVIKKIFIQLLPKISNNIAGKPMIACKGEPVLIQGSVPIGGNGNYQYQWESATDSVKFSLISSGTNELYLNSIQSTSWFRRKVVSGYCADTSAPVKIEVYGNGLWTGASNTDWNNPQNWCLQKIPDTITSVLINSATTRFPEITGLAKCKDLWLAAGAGLNISGSLQISGQIKAGMNSINAGNGTIHFTGNQIQQINASLFEKNSLHTLILENPQGLEMNDSLFISGELVLRKGILKTQDQLVLRNGASIPAAANGTGINGKVSIEHLWPGGKRVFRLTGHPFQENFPLSILTPYLDITGEKGAANGFTTTASNASSAFRLNSTMATDINGIDTGWQPFTNTNGLNENLWKTGNGIKLFFRGSKGQGLDGKPAGNGMNGTYYPQPVSIRLTGNLRTGDQEIPLTAGDPGAYHLIANPYPCNINIANITRSHAVGNICWIWEENQGKQGGYTAYPMRDKYILPPFSAFIVKNNSSTAASLFFSENTKCSDCTISEFPVPRLDDIFYIDLRLETDSIFQDRILLLATDSARNGFDRNDGEKLLNPDVNFYTLGSDGKMLSIDARPLNNMSIIPLGIQPGSQGNFRFRVAKAVLPVSNSLQLHDKFLKKWMPLVTDSTYSFHTTNDTITFGNNRFEIATPVITDSLSSKQKIAVKVFPVPAHDRLRVHFKAEKKAMTFLIITGMNGIPYQTQNEGKLKEADLTADISRLLPGVYNLTIKCGDETGTVQFIKQ